MHNNQQAQRQINELQKLIELLNKKILHLRTSRITAIDPGAIFSIDTQLEELEAERSKVQQEIEDLETAAGEIKQQQKNVIKCLAVHILKDKFRLLYPDKIYRNW